MSLTRLPFAVATLLASSLALAQATAPATPAAPPAAPAAAPAAQAPAKSAAQPATANTQRAPAKATTAPGAGATSATGGTTGGATNSAPGKGSKSAKGEKSAGKGGTAGAVNEPRRLLSLYAGVMTEDEKTAYRNKVRDVKTYDQCKALLEETHKTMEPRAKAKGTSIAQSPTEACDQAKARGRVKS